MRCLISGVAGFVGSNIAAKLLELDYEVYGCDDMSFGDKRNIPDGLAWMDMGFENAGERYLSEYDVLIHAATKNIIWSQSHPVPTFISNGVDTIKFFQKFKGKIIYLSSASVYNNAKNFPTKEETETHVVNAYDASKLIVELFLQERGDQSTLRLSNVIGENQRPDNPYCGVVAKMIHSCLNGDPIIINGTGTHTRDYTYVGDVVNAVIKAVEFPPINTCVNISTEKETSVIALGEMIAKAIGVPFDPRYAPARAIDTITRRVLGNHKAKRMLDWYPKTSLEEAIKKTIAWQKSY